MEEVEQTSDVPRIESGYESVAIAGLTRHFTPPAQATYLVYPSGVPVGERNTEFLQGLAAFGNMTTAQAMEIFFSEIARSTFFDAIKRLKKSGMIDAYGITWRTNATGGGPHGCYQIGKAAWPVYYPGTRYEPQRNKPKLEHTLLVVDTHIEILRLARAGVLRIERFAIETDAKEVLAGVELKPDAYYYLDLVRQQRLEPFFLEIDTGSEGKAKILEKINRYIHVLNSSEYRGDDDGFPRVLFVVKKHDGQETDRRIRELERYIKMVSNVPEDLFTVLRWDKLPNYLM